jgi:aryl-alcohol dehydrogenase-like predicted oxidoreductase
MYYRWDVACSVEEMMRHLHALVMARQVLYLGASDMPAWVVVKANQCEFVKQSTSILLISLQSLGITG